MTSYQAIDDAKRAAERYAQLSYYHMYSKQCRYDRGIEAAWRVFLRQFYTLPRGTMLASIVAHSYTAELRRLVEGGGRVQEKAGRWHSNL